MRILIVGGGITGLCSAYYLQKAGHEIIILDKSDLKDGCSYGNAGMITPSHFIPLASPGIVAKGIRWMFNAESPFYIKPRMDLDLIRWAWRFYRSANDKNVRRSVELLRDFNWMGKQLYQQMAKDESFEFFFKEKGIIMLYKSEHVEEEELKVAEQANRMGIKTVNLSLADLQKMEPYNRIDVRGGIHYPGDAHLSPNLLMAGLKKVLAERGVLMQDGVDVKDFELTKGKASGLLTNKGVYHADKYIIAGGSWTPRFNNRLGANIFIQGGKGYSFTLNDVENNLNYPSILTEAKVAVTPMGNKLRFGGTMEIAGLDLSINQKRVMGIVKSIPKYYPDFDLRNKPPKEVWSGLRPCTPDGLPFIGHSPIHDNVIVAAGHAMMGLSLGPATGKLVQELVDQEASSLRMDLFDLARFS